MSDAIEIKDFSGGITDYPLNASLNKYEIGDNLILEKQANVARPILRPGSDLITGANSRIPEGNQRVAYLQVGSGADLLSSQQLLTFTAKKVYRKGITGAPASFTNADINVSNTFPLADANTVYSVTECLPNFFLVANSVQDKPAIVYLNSAYVNYIAYTAGVPKPNKVAGPLTVVNADGDTTFAPIALNSGAGSSYTILVSLILGHGMNGYNKFIKAYSELLTTIPITVNMNAGLSWGIQWPSFEVAFTNTFASYPRNYGMFASICCSLPNGTVLYVSQSFNLVGTVDPWRFTVSGGTITFNPGAITPVVPSYFSQRVYTTGGVFGNTLPPQTALVHTNGELTYYAQEGLDKTVVYQSIPGIPWAVPRTFVAYAPSDVVGVSSAMSVTVLACRNSAYRIEGAFDQLGRGGMVLQRISDSSSCVSGQSLVQTDFGLFWAGEDGIYHTDGYRVQRINTDYDATWRKFIANANTTATNGELRIQGCYDRLNQLVLWTVNKKSYTEGSTDCDAVYVLDLNYPLTSESTFTTWSGGDGNSDSFKAFSCTSLSVDTKNGLLLRGDSRGIVHKHVISTHAGLSPIYTDRYYESKHDAYITSQVNKSVLPTLKTIAFDFGSASNRKWVAKASFVFDTSDNTVPYFLDVQSINDRGRFTGLMDRIKIDSSDVVGSRVFIPKWRHFPRTGLRCLYKQLKFFAPQVLLAESTVANTATVTGSSVVAASIAWPTYVAGSGYIYFADDNYTQGYLITDVTNLVLTVSGTPPAGAGKHWRLYGNTQTQRFGLASYTINYTMLGDKTERYSTGEATP